MPTVEYIQLKQCYPTSRNEVTRVLSEVSENGLVRGRVMHDTPTYELEITHEARSKEDLALFDTWWKDNFNNRVLITWGADMQRYIGIFKEPPQVSVDPGLPFNVFTIQVTLLVKKHIFEMPTSASSGTPGSFDPLGSLPPENFTILKTLGSLGNTTTWASGEYVVLGDASEAHWDGTTWVAGRKP